MDKYTQRLKKIEDVLTANLPESANKDWKEAVFSTLPEAVKEEHIAQLLKPCRELLLLGGKRMRPLLLVLVAEMLSDDSQKAAEHAYPLVPLIEFVHTASLIHDDIEDSADMRRGKPCAYITYGTDTAINAGTWLYFNAMSAINSAAVPAETKLKLYETLTVELRRLHMGQAMDIYWHKNDSLIPIRSEYEAMVRLKTGTLTSLAAKIGAIAAGACDKELEKIGSIAADIGVGFQVLDDVINLTKGNPGKKRGDDIVEGKKSLPILLHLEKRQYDLPKITNLFSQAKKEGSESSAVEAVIKLLEESNAITEAADYSKKTIANACQTLQKNYSGKEATDLITGLFSAMIERNI